MTGIINKTDFATSDEFLTYLRNITDDLETFRLSKYDDKCSLFLELLSQEVERPGKLKVSLIKETLADIQSYVSQHHYFLEKDVTVEIFRVAKS